MMGTFNDWSDRLEAGLQLPLPGTRAYDRVRPSLTNGEPIRFSERPDRTEGAVLIAFYLKDGRIHLPLIQRPDYDGVHGGQVALPGGKREPGEADLVQTALRESQEEIGLEPRIVRILGCLSSYYVGASNFQVLPVVGCLREKPVFVPEPGEVAEIIEAPLDEFRRPDAIKEKILNVRGFSLNAPYFDVADKVIWGATAAMLSELMMIIDEI